MKDAVLLVVASPAAEFPTQIGQTEATACDKSHPTIGVAKQFLKKI